MMTVGETSQGISWEMRKGKESAGIGSESLPEALVARRRSPS
jgi:hypothetical protein